MADVEQNETKNHPPGLEETLYQFIKLYDSWSLEQRLVGKREAEMIKSIETFNAQAEKLVELRRAQREEIESLKTQIPRQVEQALKETTVQASQTLSVEAKKLFEQETFFEVKKIFTLYRGKGFWVRWKTLGLLTLTSAITGTLIGLYLIFEWSWPYGMYKKHYQFYYQRENTQKILEEKRAEIEELKETLKKSLKDNEQKTQELEKLKKFESKQSIDNRTLWHR
jgi:regulator of replication initiation timing